MQTFEQSHNQNEIEDVHSTFFNRGSSIFCFNLKNPLFRIFLYFLFLLLLVIIIIVALVETIHRKSLVPPIEILKPQIDSRNFTIMELSNNLRVLLVSEENSNYLGASLSVSAGSKHEKIPGLAHFLEHLLFMGSKTYPKEGLFFNEVNLQNGYANAYTDSECTVYYFQVKYTNNTNDFKNIIDIWSHFFIDPSFEKDSILREINAVQSEYINALTNKDFILSFLIKLLINPDYPGSKFDIGSVESLINEPKEKGIDILDQLKMFYSDFYTVDNMNLVIYTDQTMVEETKEIIENSFKNISKKKSNKTDFKYFERPDSGEFFKTKMLKYKKDNGKTFTIVAFFDEIITKYKEKPLEYLINLINSDHFGGLKQILKNKGFIIDLNARVIASDSDLSLLTIDFYITNKGRDHIEDIISSCFEYVNLIQEKGISSDMYEYMSKLSELNWNFKDRKDVFKELPIFARNMQYLKEDSIKNILMYDDVFLHYNNNLLLTTLKQFSLDNSALLLGTDDLIYLNHSAELNNKSNLSYFQIKTVSNYSKIYDIYYEISSLNKTIAIKESSNFVLPSKSKYIPTELFKYSNSDLFDSPKSLFVKNNHGELWFQKISGIPLSYFTVEFISPLAHLSATNCLLTKLTFNWLSYFLSPIFKELNSLGYEVDLNEDTLKIKGFSDKLHEIISDIADEITQSTEESFIFGKYETFRSILNNTIEKIAGELSQKTHLQSFYHLKNILINEICNFTEMENAAKNIRIEDFVEFINKFLTKNYLKGLIVGSIKDERALEMWKGLTKKTINSLGVENITLISKERILNLSNKSINFTQKNLNQLDQNNIVLNYYQYGKATIENTALFVLLAPILQNQAFDQLRTKSQLGYIAGADQAFFEGIAGFFILVKGNSANPLEISEAMDKFIHYFKEFINNLSNEEFEKMKKSVYDELISVKKDLKNIQENIWKIVKGDMTSQFDLKNKIAGQVKMIGKNELAKFWNEIVNNVNGKISVQIWRDELFNMLKKNGSICENKYEEFSNIERFERIQNRIILK